ncbi:MAG: hypothetical protein IKI15_02000 [Lachnospiraceae bacterium]|nr:hypothetical protein [Lachnospiraceae bacterium]
MKKNKALHEAAMPERKANPLGTGPELTEQDWWDITYGEEPIYDPVYDEKEGKAGGVNPYSIVQITSSRNEEVTKKINECLENTARTLADPGYLPDVAGILNIVKEKGFPRTEVYSDCDYVCREILSVRIICKWTWWAEDRSFPDWNSFYYDWKGREEVLVGPGIELDYEVLQEINGGPILRVYYVVREVHYLNFDRRTGEVLSLSDMFPKGFDYLEYVNREAKKETNRYLMADDDVFWMAKEEVFGFSDDEYRKTGEVRGAYGGGYDESLYEYDGGLLPVQLTGDEEFGLIGKAYLNIKDNHGKHISIWYKEIFAD